MSEGSRVKGVSRVKRRHPDIFQKVNMSRRRGVPPVQTLLCATFFLSFFCCTCLRNSLCVPSCVSPSLSLSLHLSLFLCCCVAPGYTVMCPPSVPPSLSLSLCPCHLQLLCETRHSAWGREAGRQGGWEVVRGMGEGRDSFIDRANKHLVSSEKKKKN